MHLPAFISRMATPTKAAPGATPADTAPAWPHAQPAAGPVVYAFTSGSQHYYRFASDENLPQRRFFKAEDYMIELTCRMSRDYMTSLCDAVLAACNKGDMASVVVAITEAKKRLAWITNVDALFKLASCYYFTAQEDPAQYDNAVAARHMAHWKQHERDIPAFFLRTRLAAYLPSTDFVVDCIQTFTTAGARIEKAHLSAFLSMLSNAPNASAAIASVHSQAEALTSWLELLDSASSPTSAGSTV